jgi:hypothetical protein
LFLQEKVEEAEMYFKKCYKNPSLTSKIQVLDTLKDMNRPELQKFANDFTYVDLQDEVSDKLKIVLKAFILA